MGGRDRATRDTPLGAVAHLRAGGRRGRSRPGRRARTVGRSRARPRLVVASTTCSSSTTRRCRCSVRCMAITRRPACVVTVPDAGAAPDPLGATLAVRRRAQVVGAGPARRPGGGHPAAPRARWPGRRRHHPRAFLDASDGNALYLREMVLGSLTAGALREVDGVWRLEGTPQTVRRAPLGGAGPGRQPRARGQGRPRGPRGGRRGRPGRPARRPRGPGRRGGRAGRPAASRGPRSAGGR